MSERNEQSDAERGIEQERPSTVQERAGVSPDRLDDPPQAEGDRREEEVGGGEADR